MPCRRMPRRGLSLLEVLIALTIFLLAVVVLGNLVTTGSNRAMDIKLEGQATQLCHSKLAEVVAGAVQLSSQSDVPFDDDPDWVWSVDAQPETQPGLWRVQVRVTRQRSDEPRTECSLTQLILDPKMRGSTQAPTVAPTVSSSSSSSSSSSGTGTGGTTGGTGGSTGGTGTGGSTGTGGGGSTGTGGGTGGGTKGGKS